MFRRNLTKLKYFESQMFSLICTRSKCRRARSPKAPGRLCRSVETRGRSVTKRRRVPMPLHLLHKALTHRRLLLLIFFSLRKTTVLDFPTLHEPEICFLFLVYLREKEIFTSRNLFSPQINKISWKI